MFRVFVTRFGNIALFVFLKKVVQPEVGDSNSWRNMLLK